MEAFISGIDLFKKTDAYKNYPDEQMLNNNSTHINISEESMRWSSPLAQENSGWGSKLLGNWIQELVKVNCFEGMMYTS